LLGDFASSDALVDNLNDQLASIANGSAEHLRAHAYWVLADTRDFRLALYAQEVAGDEGPVALESSPAHRLVACAWPESTKVGVYRAPSAARDVFDPSAILEARGQLALARGATLRVRAYQDVVDIWVPGTRGLVLELVGKPQGQVVWAYDPSTLRALSPIAADKNAAHLEYLAWTLAKIGDSSSVPAIAALTEHPAHFVRWTAVRTVMELDQEQGLTLLERAARDRHPHVSAAARRALAQLQDCDEESGGTDP
jgi:hypothetical protein